jgi:hypothetical protein
MCLFRFVYFKSIFTNKFSIPFTSICIPFFFNWIWIQFNWTFNFNFIPCVRKKIWILINVVEINFKVFNSIQFKLHTMPFNTNVTCVVDPSVNALPNTLTHQGLSSGTKSVTRIMLVGMIMVWLCHWHKCE